MVSHIIIFKDEDFKGAHMHIFDSVKKLPLEFDNKVSSLVVLAGKWKLFDGPDFTKRIGGIFTKGVYSFSKIESLDMNSHDVIITDEMKTKIKENKEKDRSIEVKFADVISSIQIMEEI